MPRICFPRTTAITLFLLSLSTSAQNVQENMRPPDGGTREVLVSIFIPGVAGAPFTANSRQLGLNLVSFREDPRFGTQKFEVSDVVLGDPDPKLFLPPEGFKLLDLRNPSEPPNTSAGRWSQPTVERICPCQRTCGNSRSLLHKHTYSHPYHC
jgi:hypothetical protein